MATCMQPPEFAADYYGLVSQALSSKKDLHPTALGRLIVPLISPQFERDYPCFSTAWKVALSRSAPALKPVTSTKTPLPFHRKIAAQLLIAQNQSNQKSEETGPKEIMDTLKAVDVRIALIKKYSGVFNLYQEIPGSGGFLRFKTDQIDTALTSSILLEILEKAMEFEITQTDDVEFCTFNGGHYNVLFMKCFQLGKISINALLISDNHLIGKGASSVVCQVLDVLNGFFTLKFSNSPDKLENEYADLFSLQKISKTLSAFLPKFFKIGAANDDENLYFIFIDYIGPNLWEWLKQKPLIEARLKQGSVLVQALQEFHKYGITHGDFKLNNICVGPEGTKIIDFETAVFGNAKRKSRIVTTLPTPGYASKCDLELSYLRYKHLLDKKPWNPVFDADCKALDIYGLGIVLYQLLVGNLYYPYPGLKEGDAKGYADPTTTFDDHILKLRGRKCFVNLLSKMVAHDPKTRPNIETVSKEWVDALKTYMER